MEKPDFLDMAIDIDAVAEKLEALESNSKILEIISLLRDAEALLNELDRKQGE